MRAFTYTYSIHGSGSESGLYWQTLGAAGQLDKNLLRKRIGKIMLTFLVNRW